MEFITEQGRIIAAMEGMCASLEPGQATVPEAKAMLQFGSKMVKLGSYLQANAAAIIENPEQVAQVTGTSVGKAKETVATGKVLGESPVLSAAMQHGRVSLDQATEIARAEEAAPGAAKELLKIATKESFQMLKEKARDVKLTAEQHRDLGQRQRDARSARSYIDPLGMVNIPLRFQPHVGTPIVNRAEAEAQRLYREAKKKGTPEPFERYLADAYASLLGGNGKGSTTRPELVVLVSNSVVKRGWTDVRQGEHCKIPGVGPISPEAAKEVAEDAFLSAVFFDGTDLRNFKRWGRYRPKELQVALELGKAPDFDGIKCAGCGNRFRPEIDHIDPAANGGPNSLANNDPLCHRCHLDKTMEDRRAGKLKPQPGRPGNRKQESSNNTAKGQRARAPD